MEDGKSASAPNHGSFANCPEGFFRGIEEFNRGQFFECHETLEEVWNKQALPEKELTQGIIQTAVAYYHHLRGNDSGALKLLKRALPRLRKFEPQALGIDVKALSEQVSNNIAQLEEENPIGAEPLTITGIGYTSN